MRLTIIGPAYPLRGGIAHHVYWLNQEMTARGHAVQVISFRRLYPSILFPGKSELDASRLQLDAQAERILTPLNPLSWSRAFQAVERFHPDVIVFQWWQPFFAPLTGWLARKFRRNHRRIIVECHNVVPHEGTPIDRVLTRYAFRPVDEFIVHARADKERLQQIAHGKRINISPLPVLREFEATGDSKRDGRRILFFGKVRRYKGLDVLLEALPKVLARIDGELLIVGEFYDDIETYQRIIRKHGIEGHVRIINQYISNEEVGKFFAQADVLVLPYISASQSGVAKIAFANNLPVIASRTGGLCDDLVEGVNGLSFRPGDIDELADKIISYFANGYGPIFSSHIAASHNDISACQIAEFIENAAREAHPGSPALARLDNDPDKIG